VAARNHDVVLIGAGPNGLVTAFYLARAGLKPLLLERRPVVGGVAVTEEFHPGFRCSTLAHDAACLSAEIVQEMGLERHGLQMIRPNPGLMALTPEGSSVGFYREAERTAAEIAKLSPKDAEKYPGFQRTLARMAGVLQRLLRMTPPDIDEPDTADLWNLLKTFKKYRGLGRKDMFQLLRYAPMAVADLVGEWFENELLRATIATGGIFGGFCGPWSAGTGSVFLLRSAADSHTVGSTAFPRGGMGALTAAMAAAATQAGAEIRTGAEVAHIKVSDGRATGVVLAGGEEIEATAVISNADPKRTFLSLVDPVHLPPSFIVKVRNYLCRGATAKVNLALSGPPVFPALARTGATDGAGLAARIHIGPEIDYLERAFDAVKYGQFSEQPYLEVSVPSAADASLAPAGQHVMSIFAHFAPYKLRQGDWSSQRAALGEAVMKTLAQYAPELPGQIVARQVLTPSDLEETFGLTGGHLFHGELTLDQLFTMRPLLGWARYRTPIAGLYLCGSGTHPGTGLTGRSGANAAREILRDLRR
jgi:phytoene dehydrogenase-like protein